jgi:hypothetical protein
MSDAEQLLNEAQYAFASITAGESSENRRNAARAKSLCKKIFRKYPGTSEAVVAHGIMMRLGEEAFMSHIEVEHVHETHDTAHSSSSTSIVPQVRTAYDEETVSFDWAGLLALILKTPRTILVVFGFLAVVLFGILGTFVFVPLVLFAIFTGPFRSLMKPAQRQEMNKFIVRANAWIEAQRKKGRGLS